MSRSNWRTMVGVVAFAVLLTMTGWHRGWFSREPVYQGRTVTQWLDSMAMFDETRNSDETGQRSFRYAASARAVTNDPAIQALLQIGSNAVPVLVERASEEPRWSAVRMTTADRLRTLWETVKDRLRPGPNPPRSIPRRWSSFQQARIQAAYLAMLALGTNDNAGLPKLLETFATSPTNTVGNRGWSMFDAALVASTGLPGHRVEIVEGLAEGLHDTNAVIRWAAANLAGTFWSYSGTWKSQLLPMVGDPDAKVAVAALWTLATHSKDDPDMVTLLGKKLSDTNAPADMRASAAAGLGLAGASAARFLPLLQVSANDPDNHLASESSQAVKMIGAAIAERESPASGSSTEAGH